MSDTKQVEKVKLTVSGILADLANGLDRVAIRQKYQLSATDVKRLFENPKLKGTRVKKAPAFELEDDTQQEAVAAPPKKSVKSKAVIQSSAPAVATVEEALADEQVIQQESPAPSGEVREVATEEDVEVVTETNKGLW